MKSLIAVTVLVTLASVGAAGDRPGGPAAPPRSVRRDASYRAYWLTAAADGGKSEYRRLLITHGRIEDLAGHTSWSALPLDNMAMTFRTYRTDSLWDEPFRCVQRFGSVESKARTTAIDGIDYVYEPCPLQDVVRLLENPTGTVPVHRRASPLAGAEQTAKAFRLLLREQMKTEK